MIKKKAKSKSGAKKSEKKKSNKSKKETSPAEVLKEVTAMVKSEAAGIAQAVIAEGKRGQVAPMRYLFEMASIFPRELVGDQASEEEECLAKTLLRRLNLPDEPIHRDEDEETESSEVKSASESSENASGVEATKNSEGEGKGEAGKDSELA